MKIFDPSQFRYLLPTRFLTLLVMYAVILFISLFLAYNLRFDFAIPAEFLGGFYEHIFWIIPIQIILLLIFGQFAGLLSFFRFPDMNRIFWALISGSGIILIIWYILDGAGCPPRGVILGDFVFAFFLICGFRLSLRIYRERFMKSFEDSGRVQRRVAIVGAGDAGSQVASDLLSRRVRGLKPVIFLDDDEKKWNKQIHGIRVVDSPDNLESVVDNFGVEQIIIAMPSASAHRIGEISRDCRRLELPVFTVPSLMEITTGKVLPTRLRPVQIEDLLGREPVQLESDNIREMIHGQCILVTGAGGSIGSELCRQVAFFRPSKLVYVDQSEVQLFVVQQELNGAGFGVNSVGLIGDVTDYSRMKQIIGHHQPDIIFHAAAHKHVPIMENQPGEAIKNNSLGTRLMANLAMEFEVKRFLLISTDKAINPTSVMGASKRLAEIYIQSLNQTQSSSTAATQFMAVRFGNVLGSSGSVVPIFRQQIAEGGPVEVTHPEVTRFFMTIPEAVGLVLQCATQGSGGEIFVLDMGTPVKILDLAHQMIELSGFQPGVDIELKIVGLRPGEKLYEELQHDKESFVETRHPRILRFVSDPLPMKTVQEFIEEVTKDVNSGRLEDDQIKQKLKKLIPEYKPYFE